VVEAWEVVFLVWVAVPGEGYPVAREEVFRVEPEVFLLVVVYPVVREVFQVELVVFRVVVVSQAVFPLIPHKTVVDRFERCAVFYIRCLRIRLLLR
jgi:hypothetical protein